MDSSTSKPLPQGDLLDLAPVEEVPRPFSLRRSLPAPWAWAIAALLYAVAVAAQNPVIHENPLPMTPYMPAIVLLAVRFGARVGAVGGAFCWLTFVLVGYASETEVSFTNRPVGTVFAGVLVVALAWVLGYGTQRLVDSEERFHTSIENLLEPFGIYRAVRGPGGEIVDFVIEYVNPAAAAATGLSRGDQIGRRLLELFPGRLESGLFDDYCRVVETGEPLLKDAVSIQDVLGEQMVVRAFDMRVTKLGDGFAAAWRDITERKNAERELKESEERLMTMVRNLPLSLLMQDRDLRYVWIAEPKLGFRHEDVLGKTDWDLLEPEEAERVTAIKRRVLETGRAEHYETPIKVGNHEYWWQSTATQICGDDGEVRGVALVTINITDRKLGERERAWAALAFDAACEAVIAVSADWTVQSWNSGAERLFGYARGEALGRPVTFLAASTVQSKLAAAMERAQVGATLESQVIDDVVAEDGTPRRIEASFAPVRNAEGEQIGVTIVARGVDRTRRDAVRRGSRGR